MDIFFNKRLIGKTKNGTFYTKRNILEYKNGYFLAIDVLYKLKLLNINFIEIMHRGEDCNKDLIFTYLLKDFFDKNKFMCNKTPEAINERGLKTIRAIDIQYGGVK